MRRLVADKNVMHIDGESSAYSDLPQQQFTDENERGTLGALLQYAGFSLYGVVRHIMYILEAKPVPYFTLMPVTRASHEYLIEGYRRNPTLSKALPSDKTEIYADMTTYCDCFDHIYNTCLRSA